MSRTAISRTHGKDYVDFGKKIARARESMGLTQKDASSRLGIPQSTYAGYETGTRKVPLSLIKELSRFYEVSADHLLGRDTGSEASDIADYISKNSFTQDEINEILRYAKYIKASRE